MQGTRPSTDTQTMTALTQGSWSCTNLSLSSRYQYQDWYLLQHPGKLLPLPDQVKSQLTGPEALLLLDGWQQSQNLDHSGLTGQWSPDFNVWAALLLTCSPCEWFSTPEFLVSSAELCTAQGKDLISYSLVKIYFTRYSKLMFRANSFQYF